MGTKEDIFQNARPKLFGLAYRLLGTRMDAEDLVQDAWLKWNGANTDTIQDPQAWLITVVTRLGIDRQRHLRARREDYVGPWLPEPILDEGPKSAEDIMELASDLSLAFLVALERLGPDERAAFLLQEVFDYAYADIANVLGKSVVASRQLVSRARARIRSDRPRFKVTPEQQRNVAEQFVSVLMREDQEGFARLMADQIRWIADGGGKANAATHVVRGKRATSRLAMGLARRWQGSCKATVEILNGQYGIILWREGNIQAAMELETDGAQVLAIYSVVNPDKLKWLGVPDVGFDRAT